MGSSRLWRYRAAAGGLLVLILACGGKVAWAACDAGAGQPAQTLRWDPVLRQRWTVKMDCEHPERPLVAARAVGGGTSAATGKANDAVDLHGLGKLIVRPGDAVRVWESEGLVRMELSGVAEENGFLGGKIRVRLVNVSEMSTGMQQRLEGVVRGPRDVEVQP